MVEQFKQFPSIAISAIAVMLSEIPRQQQATRSSEEFARWAASWWWARSGGSLADAGRRCGRCIHSRSKSVKLLRSMAPRLPDELEYP